MWEPPRPMKDCLDVQEEGQHHRIRIISTQDHEKEINEIKEGDETRSAI